MNISLGGVRPTRIIAACKNEVAHFNSEEYKSVQVRHGDVVSDEEPPSSDPKASPGIYVLLPAVPRLKYNGNIHDDSLELYEDSIIDPNDSDLDCGLCDSSDSDVDEGSLRRQLCR